MIPLKTQKPPVTLTRREFSVQALTTRENEERGSGDNSDSQPGRNHPSSLNSTFPSQSQAFLKESEGTQQLNLIQPLPMCLNDPAISPLPASLQASLQLLCPAGSQGGSQGLPGQAGSQA